MSRVTVLCTAWLTLLVGGWCADFFFALRVPGVGAVMLSLIPLLLARSRPLLFCAAVLTPLALLSPLLARPEIWQDIEELEGRALSCGFGWGAVVVGLMQERWRQLALLANVRLAGLIDTAPDIIWVGRPGAPATQMSDGWPTFTGQRREQALGMGWLDAIHVDDRARASALWRTPDPNAWPDTYDIELRVWHEASSSYHAVALSIRPLRGPSGELLDWVGVFAGREQRKTQDRQLAAQREQLVEAHRLARAGNWQLDIATSTVRLSPELSEAFGGPAEAGALPLADALQAFTADVRDAIATELRRLIDDGGDHYGEYTVMLPDGVRRVAALTARSKRSGDDGAVVVGSAQDVTDRVRAQERQRELEQQLFQSSKLQTVGELATGIAHDFNNVLATMIGFSELARKRLLGMDTQSYAYLERVLEAGRRAGELVRTLMSFARAKRGDQPRNASAIELAPVVTETLKLVRASVPDGIEIAQDIAPNISMRMERVHLQDALLNLCINARDALGGAGRLTVTLSMQETHDTCAVCGERVRGAAAVLSVRDNGAGVDPAALPYIFEPFYSTKSEQQGTGMGLAMVARVVHEDGGHVLLSSRRGDTRFSLVFPAGSVQVSEHPTTVASVPAPVSIAALAVRAVADASANAAALAADSVASAGPRQRVMVVDDEPSIGRLIASALESYGLVVTVFVEPREAAAAYQVNPERWDLLITDLTMPGMSGLELAGLVREVRWLPVLLLTGGGASDEELRGAGVVDQIMRKPFAMNEFVRVTAGLLRDTVRNEVPALLVRG